MTIRGMFVQTFDEATFALPAWKPIRADYPFILPKIVERSGETITIEGRGGKRETLTICRDPEGEFCVLAQSGTFERQYNQYPAKFILRPFRSDGKVWEA